MECRGDVSPQGPEVGPLPVLPPNTKAAILWGMVQGGKKPSKFALLSKPQCREILGKFEGNLLLLSLSP